MLSRCWKINGDSRLMATGDRGHHSVCNYYAAKLKSFISIYHLSKLILRKLNNID